MRRSLVALAVVLGALAFAPGPTVAGETACPGPTIDTPEGAVLERDVTLTVEGRDYAADCDDLRTCSGSLGCDSCEEVGSDEPPDEEVDLVLLQRGRTWTLATAPVGTAEEGRLGRVTWRFVLPVDVLPGNAQLVSGDGTQVIEIRVS